MSSRIILFVCAVQLSWQHVAKVVPPSAAKGREACRLNREPHHEDQNAASARPHYRILNQQQEVKQAAE